MPRPPPTDLSPDGWRAYRAAHGRAGAYPDEFNSTLAICFAAKQGSDIFDEVPRGYLTPDFLVKVLEKQPEYLGCLDAEEGYTVTPEMCSTAVRKYGEAIMFVPDEMQTLELCRIAVRDDGENIQYVPNEHIHELYDDAVRNYPGAFTMIPTHMQTAELYIRGVRCNCAACTPNGTSKDDPVLAEAKQLVRAGLMSMDDDRLFDIMEHVSHSNYFLRKP